MNVDRGRRQEEHDRFVELANLTFPAAPTDALLQKVRAVDSHLYERLGEGDRWINEKLDAFLVGRLDSLECVYAAWRDWVRLYRYGVTSARADESISAPTSRSAITANTGNSQGGANDQEAGITTAL